MASSGTSMKVALKQHNQLSVEAGDETNDADGCMREGAECQFHMIFNLDSSGKREKCVVIS